MKLEELEVYKFSEELADLVWSICTSWEWFEKDTIGKQLKCKVVKIRSDEMKLPMTDNKLPLTFLRIETL